VTKVVVIGTGFGERAVAPVYRSLGADVTLLSARDVAGIAKACAAGADLVSVHSPPFLHHDHVMVAVDHGLAVLCDKPFGCNATEARAMRDRAVAAGVLHFLNFELRHLPARRRARDLLAAGAVGDLVHISLVQIGRGLRHRAHGWLFDAALGGGWIGAYGSHAIDMLLWYSETDVQDCRGVLRTEITSRAGPDGEVVPSTAEDAFSAWFVMEGGVTASIDTASAAPVNLPRRLVLAGTAGTIEIDDDLIVRLRRPREPDQTFRFDAADGDPHVPALEPWLREVLAAVGRGESLAPSFHDGVAVAEVMDRLRAQPPLPGTMR